MKIKITESMEKLHSSENIKNGYPNIEVKLHTDDDGLESSIWKTYAYDAKSIGEQSAWSDGCTSFDEALENIIQKFEAGREPVDPFVEK
jgi:hypothetical protein